MEEMKMIESLYEKLTEETINILNKNYPMDSREFLTGVDAEIVSKNDEKIKELSEKYFNTYNTLQLSEQQKCEYKNIKGTYYQNTHNSKGLIKVSPNGDEYQLREAFKKAYQFGIQALDKMHESKNDNQDEYLKNQQILNECFDILKVHFWGENSIKSLNRYQKRLEAGRTVEDDIDDYKKLIEECRKLSIDYSLKNLNGINEEERELFLSNYKKLFETEEVLTEFIPPEIFSEVSVNLHWMKVDAEREPQKFIDENINEENNKHK